MSATVMLAAGPNGTAVAAEPNDIERVNVSSSGAQSASPATEPRISADGRWVAFFSAASDLVPGDVNGRTDVFVRDRVAGVTELVSVGDSEGGPIQGNDTSTSPSISADGRYVAFASLADNFAAGDDNFMFDIFVRDRPAGVTTRLGLEDVPGDLRSGNTFPSISADGRMVAHGAVRGSVFDLRGRIVVHDREAGTARVISLGDGGSTDQSSVTPGMISGDGGTVVFHGRRSQQSSQRLQVFAQDGVGTPELISSGASGGDGNADSVGASVSHDGRYVAFESHADNLVPGDANGAADVFVHDRQTGETEIASLQADGSQFTSASRGELSPSGRTVAFQNSGFIWLRDLQADTTEMVDRPSSVGFSGGFGLSVSADDRYVAFRSDKPNLVEDDTNRTHDLFVRDRGAPPELSVDDVSGPESDSSARFTVSLAEPARADLTVNYATTDGTAVAGSDYQSTSGALTIAAGDTSASIDVPIVDDSVVEDDETFTVTLSEPSHPRAVLARAAGTATILNDDEPRPCTPAEQVLNVVRQLLTQPPIDCRPA